MPDRHTARLSLTPGRGGTVEIDGHDIAPVTRALHLAAAVGEIPTLYLDLAIDLVEVDGEVTVTIPEGTRRALVALGWTPPADTDAKETR
ncbi:hypothetical protein [Thermomonospora amylolytica]|uniref:hypothetical protein n=1 Tax=Thermomonospora amylolytica TaxID=1411117 RepID=UPI000E6B8182|nr:hypothetical protein [Thermomonospora amylolytica]